VRYTRQTCLCRVPTCAECLALGKGALCREPNFTECDTRQSLLCRVPDKRQLAKNTTLGKASDSGSASMHAHRRCRRPVVDGDATRLSSPAGRARGTAEGQARRGGEQSCMKASRRVALHGRRSIRESRRRLTYERSRAAPHQYARTCARQWHGPRSAVLCCPAVGAQDGLANDRAP
jgi:hypothetical protein